MRWLSLFLACQHLCSEMNLRECEDQSWFDVQAVPVFHFDWCKLFVKYHWSSLSVCSGSPPSWLFYSTNPRPWKFRGTEETRNISGLSESGPKFEPRTSGTQRMNITQSGPAFDCFISILNDFQRWFHWIFFFLWKFRIPHKCYNYTIALHSINMKSGILGGESDSVSLFGPLVKISLVGHAISLISTSC
jgi:hypothetical protein